MIDRDGNARIMDFGIARSVKAKGITGADVMIGTPEYMSPEQVDGKEADARSDIYSLGIVLFEMLTGRLPFEGETPLSVAVKQKSEAPPDPRRAQRPDPGGPGRPRPEMPGKGARRKRLAERSRALGRAGGIARTLPATTHALPLRKSPTSKQITVRLPSKKVWIPAARRARCALIALVVWLFLPESARPQANDRGPGLQEPDRATRPSTISRRPSPTCSSPASSSRSHFRVTSWQRLKDLLARPAGMPRPRSTRRPASRSAARTGIEAVVVGFLRQGRRDVRHRRQGPRCGHEARALRSASGPGRGLASILKTQIDEISRAVRRGRGIGRPSEARSAGPRIADLTTRSLEAYRALPPGPRRVRELPRRRRPAVPGKGGRPRSGVRHRPSLPGPGPRVRSTITKPGRGLREGPPLLRQGEREGAALHRSRVRRDRQARP